MVGHNPHSWKAYSAAAGAATTGISAAGVLDLTELETKATPVVADSLCILDSADSVTKSATLAKLAVLMNAVAQMPDGLANSLFYMAGLHDFGADTAKDTDLGEAPAKGQLIAALLITTELIAGNAATVAISISKAVTAGTKMSNDITLTAADTAATNRIGALSGAWPVSGASSTVALNGHVYVYTPAGTAGDRTAGIVGVICIFAKIS